jgi:uncharacterized protein (TIGR00297 family)
MSTFTVAACAPPRAPRASHASRLLSGASTRGGGSPATVAALGARGFAFRESIATDGFSAPTPAGVARSRGRASRPRARAFPPGFEETLAHVAGFLADPSPGVVPAVAANTAVFTFGIGTLLRGLTWPGVVNAWFLGAASLAAFGAGGYALVCLYFVFGSAVTKIKLEQKQREGIAEARGGRRGVGSVWGSGVAGAVCALAALGGFPPGPDLYRLGFVASFCSKLSDTTASEVGKAYGKTTYLSTPPFTRVPRGTEGAVSLEGTLAGVGASLFFAGVAAALGQADVRGAAVCVFAAFVATTLESWLGATTQGEAGFEWLTNDVVNAAQIVVAAAIAVAVGAATR